MLFCTFCSHQIIQSKIQTNQNNMFKKIRGPNKLAHLEIDAVGACFQASSRQAYKLQGIVGQLRRHKIRSKMLRFWQSFLPVQQLSVPKKLTIKTTFNWKTACQESNFLTLLLAQMLMSLLKRNWSGWTPKSKGFDEKNDTNSNHQWTIDWKRNHHWNYCFVSVRFLWVSNVCRPCSPSWGCMFFCNVSTVVHVVPIKSATKKSIPAKASSDLRFPKVTSTTFSGKSCGPQPHKKVPINGNCPSLAVQKKGEVFPQVWQARVGMIFISCPTSRNRGVRPKAFKATMHSLCEV